MMKSTEGICEREAMTKSKKRDYYSQRYAKNIRRVCWSYILVTVFYLNYAAIFYREGFFASATMLAVPLFMVIAGLVYFSTPSLYSRTHESEMKLESKRRPSRYTKDGVKWEKRIAPSAAWMGKSESQQEDSESGEGTADDESNVFLELLESCILLSSDMPMSDYRLSGLSHVDPEFQSFWDMAQKQLEAYIQRNQHQIQSIYWITIGVMFIGFVLISYGVFQAVNGSNINVATLTSCSGLITEFVGAFFLYIYQSTVKQTSSYVVMLERFNKLGMAIRLCSSVTDEEQKNAMRNDIVKSLLEFKGEVGG